MAIVGAGYTGLWTAYYLKRADPSLRVVVLEARARRLRRLRPQRRLAVGLLLRAAARATSAAAGASGFATCSARCSTPSTRSRACSPSTASTPTSSRAATSTVALDPAQLARLRERVADGARRWASARRTCASWTPSELARAAARRRARSARRSRRTPRACTRPSSSPGSPARSSALGVTIYEGTPVREIAPGEARTAARRRARALGGARDRGLHGEPARPAPRARADEQLDDRHRAARGERLGGRSAGQAREVLGDAAHVYVYLQRTADGRIAIGGRGVPYRFGSRTDGRGATAPRDGRAACARSSHGMFPARRRRARSSTPGRACSACRATGAPSVGADPRDAGSAGRAATSGEGVAAANLAGAHAARPAARRAHASSPRCRGSGAAPRRWEPEPLRWAAIRGVYSLYRRADAHRAPQRAPLAPGARSSTRCPGASERIASPPSIPRGGPDGVRDACCTRPTDAIATITLNRPEQLNTIVPPMPDEIEEAIELA